MTFFTLLYSLIISPIELLFEVIFTIANRITGNAGISIIFLSLAVNFLVLPLYKRADELQAEDRDIQAKMAPVLKRIKKTFKGDERFFMIQEYYRINNYKPVYALKSSVSLLLQIPFFIAAYNLLSGMQSLHGMSFGFIADLGTEDAMFHIGSFPINVLPVLMTLINIVSGIIYTKGHPVRAKVQVYGLAVIFLVLLYRSPAGLVFYWLLNNVFSLGKNIIGSLIKKSGKTVKTVKAKKKLELGEFSFLPVFLSCGVLAVLTGVLIPADVIVENPAEMVNTFITEPHNPTDYLVVSAFMALGVFVLWVPVFCLLTKKHKQIYSLIFPCMAAMGVINYVVFNKNFGFLSNKLTFEDPMIFGLPDILFNLLADIVIAAAIVFVVIKGKKIISLLMTVALGAVVILSGFQIAAISTLLSDVIISYSNTAEEVSIPLTTNGQNVVVIMMDKMNGSCIPYLFNERPDVAEKFDGFTYYPNTVSFGKYTNFGAPAVFGGYDYTPQAINARPDVPLVEKHNESLIAMPAIFADEGWKVSVVDPAYANYQWIPDLSIFDGYEGINAYHMSGVFNYKEPVLISSGNDMENRLNRNFFCYGVMKIMPYALQPVLYDNGEYYRLDSDRTAFLGNKTGKHAMEGYNELHLQAHAALSALIDVTEISDDGTNCFFVMTNNSTHDMSILKEPEYAPAENVDNTDYDMAHQDRFTVDGVTMNMDYFASYATYQCSMEACITLGEWFDYLRENGLYDNTRIIIVSDHGFGMNQFDYFDLDDTDFDVESVNPVLLVKDFNSTGFTVSDEFMTNADTPSLAFEGIVQDPVNPFTNNPIYQDVKSNGVYVYSSEEINVNTNNGTQFVDPAGYWLYVHDDIRDKDNWSLLQGEPG